MGRGEERADAGVDARSSRNANRGCGPGGQAHRAPPSQGYG